MAAPVVAAGILAGAGLLGNIYNAYQSKKESDRAAAERAAARQKAEKALSSWESEAGKILSEAEANGIQLSTPQDVETYKALRGSYDPSAYAPEYERFDKSRYNVEDYLNPQREAIVADVAKGLQHTAAGAGLGHSSGALTSIARGIADKDESLYDKAYERMLGERNFDYGAYTDYINQQQQRLNTIQQGRLAQMEQLRGDIAFDQQQQDSLLASRLSLGNTLAQSRAQLI